MVPPVAVTAASAAAAAADEDEWGQEIEAEQELAAEGPGGQQEGLGEVGRFRRVKQRPETWGPT